MPFKYQFPNSFIQLGNLSHVLMLSCALQVSGFPEGTYHYSCLQRFHSLVDLEVSVFMPIYVTMSFYMYFYFNHS